MVVRVGPDGDEGRGAEGAAETLGGDVPARRETAANVGGGREPTITVLSSEKTDMASTSASLRASLAVTVVQSSIREEGEWDVGEAGYC
jgi:hypothetical protein